MTIVAVQIAVRLAGEMSDEPDFFAEMESRQRCLEQQLAASPVVNLIGVVNASGAGGGQAFGEEQWALRFAFAAWRAEGAHVRTDELRVQRQVTREALRQYIDQIKPYAVLHIRAHLAEKTESGNPESLLVGIVGNEESDVELNEWVIRLQKPVTFDDHVFGVFTLDRRVMNDTRPTQHGEESL